MTALAYQTVKAYWTDRDMKEEAEIQKALQTFAVAVKAKTSQVVHGDPEDQLRGPFEGFMTDASEVLGYKKVVPIGETLLQDRLGKPDYAVTVEKLLVGHVELKAPGVGAAPRRFTGHNRDQWKRFQSLPNLLYCDGNEWALFRDGRPVRRLVRLSGDIRSKGRRAVGQNDARALGHLLREFLTWKPIIPTDRNGKVDLRRFAELLAPLCRMLRSDVTDALQDPRSPLVQLANDWRQLLFPDASDEQFADAYAQTVAFALLLGRSEGADPLTLARAQDALSAQHTLLSRALQVLTDREVRDEIGSSLDLLLRVIGEVPPAALADTEDPWLYFYEDFLAVYDPKLRKDAGAYYTPVEVVRAQVRLIDSLLVERLDKTWGFASPDVVTLDPAAGTGTYLLAVIDHALNRVEVDQGKGAVPGRASALAANLYGFEKMVGPFAVCELRASRALRDKGAALPEEGSQVYLTDTLESPHSEPPRVVMGFAQKEFAEQHHRATQVKAAVPVIVCLGNPPYDRHEAVDPRATDQLNKWGGWVRFGDSLPSTSFRSRGRPGGQEDRHGKKHPKSGPGKGDSSRKDLVEGPSPERILEQRERESILYSGFVKPALDAGHGVHVKNLYNLYVYFWRWGLWKVFEHSSSVGPGVISYISASSYLDGDAFCGMREHMRRHCDEIWVLDLGGEGRGTRRSENVFAIKTPVAIAVAIRDGRPKTHSAAKVHYARIEEEDRDAKLTALDAITSLGSISWEDCPEDWHAPFRPAGRGKYFRWPLLTSLMPWQHSGVECKRTWPISTEAEALARRWSMLLASDDRGGLFRETGDRMVSKSYSVKLTPQGSADRVCELPPEEPVPPVLRYAFRALDRQWIIADARLISRPRPDLWRTHGPRQVYVTSLFNHPLGSGPAVVACSEMPDRHHFRGSYGGKDVLPLWRVMNDN